MRRHAPGTSGYILPLNSSGFTLIELVIATVISTLVIGILSACLTFALRAWESTQNRVPEQSALLVDLLKRQLAEYDPTPIKFEEGNRPFFSGEVKGLAFATSHSVKAISQGVSVIARYIYDQQSKTLLYSELPLDPYHPKAIKEFAQAKPAGDGKAKVRFFAVGIADFSVGYAAKDKNQFEESWRKEDGAPVSVLLKWATLDGRAFSQLLLVNSPFEIKVDKKQQALPGGQVGGLD
ncbi:MAG: prepilin-type N-terminal cleavage/methylation domain-containing protein [Syntrophobacter sp.]